MTTGTIYSLLHDAARRAPTAPALLGLEQPPLNYGELARFVAETGARLNELGIGRDDCVAVVLPNGPQMAAAFLAVACHATCAPLNPAYRTQEFDFYLSDLNAKALLIAAGMESPARAVAAARGIAIIEVRVPPDAPAGVIALEGAAGGSTPAASPGLAQPDDVALVLHTSGTTARPKIVPLTHANLCASAAHIRETLALTPADRCLNIMPLFHIHGLVGALLSSLAAGGSVACAPGFVAPQFFAWLDAFHPTWYSAVPTMHQAVLARAVANADAIARNPLRLIRSSSASLPPTVMGELERVFGAPVIESYGMTEAAHQMASNPLPPRARKPGSVGVAAGPQIAVMGADGSLLAAGARGEVVIRGPNVMRGYGGRASPPQANAEAFRAGWFRTGDQGYMDDEGYLYLTGRIKELINRGGEKIAPREVDEALLAHPAVAEALAFGMPHPQLGEDVAAAVVRRAGSETSERELRDFVAARLADFKVPRRIVFLDEMPKGATGKPQRIGLAARLGVSASEPAAETPSEYAAARTPTEQALAALWAQALGVERPGIHDRFISLGGDSVLAALLVGRVRAAFGVVLPLLSVFDEAGTIAAMSAQVERLRREPATASDWHVGSRTDIVPLSSAQQRLWFLEQMTPGLTAYHDAAAIRLRGALDAAALERSLAALAERHEALRTIIDASGDSPRQVVHPPRAVPLPVTDLSQLPSGEGEAEARRIAAEESNTPFVLSEREPLWRARLLRLGADEHVLLLVIHHIVCDGWSLRVVERDLAALYEAFAAGQASPLTPLAAQYADYARWQAEWLASKEAEDERAYWVEQLRGAPPALDLPADRARPALQSYRGARHALTLPRETVTALAALARRHEATLFTTLLAAFNALLYRYSNERDLVVGAPVSGRTHAESEGLVGCFINSLALRTTLDGNLRFDALLARVRTTVRDALARQTLPFERLVEALHPARDMSRTPVFQVLFNFRNLHAGAAPWATVQATEFRFDAGIAAFDLSLDVTERDGALECTFEYCRELFDAATIARMAGHFENLVGSIVADPSQPIGALPLLGEAERRQLAEWSGTRTELPAVCQHQLFEAQAARTPDALAVISEDGNLSFAELNARANQLARHLRALGVGPDALVGLCVTRHPRMVIAMLAIMKAGGAYLPMDPALPDARIAYMLRDSGVPIVLTETALAPRLPPDGARLICLDRDEAQWAGEDSANLPLHTTPDNLAYVIYTSGSTGQPKGAMVLHRGLVNHALWKMRNRMTFPGDRFLQFASISFDVHFVEIFDALAAGAATVLRTPEVALSLDALVRFIERHAITEADFPTAFWHECVAAMDAGALTLPASLKLVIVGGEAISTERLAQWQRLVGRRVRWFNGYGPTETSVSVSFYEAGDETPDTPIVPIGKPITNVTVHIVDERLQPVPIGVPGELCVGGAGVGRGYLNQPDLTAQKFVPDPFSSVSGARLYRTGDLARWRPDGNIEFLGRMDTQVKVRGYRVEIGEIESALNRLPAVRECAVVAQPDPGGSSRLAAYVVLHQPGALSADALRAALRENLPDYMVPALCVFLDALPVNAQGKVERGALPRAQMESGETVAPRTETEARLARLWARILHAEQVGVHDDFFAQGGHSLLALRLLLAVEAEFGRTVPVKDLFAAPTVAQMATLLERPRAESLVVPLRTHGARPPLFLVHGIGGIVLIYRELAAHLGDDQPVYALQSAGLDGREAPLTSIEAMAERYLREVRTIQPRGPYRLGGASLGGRIAYEMAQQLRGQGECIALLALIDTHAKHVRSRWKNSGAARWLLQARAHTENLRALDWRGRAQYARERARDRLAQPALAGEAAELSARLRHVRAINARASHAYEPPPYDGAIVLFRARRQGSSHRGDRTLGWDALARGGVTVHEFDGRHDDALREPLVRNVAAQLAEHLRRAQEPPA